MSPLENLMADTSVSLCNLSGLAAMLNLLMEQTSSGRDYEQNAPMFWSLCSAFRAEVDRARDLHEQAAQLVMEQICTK